MLDNMDDKEAVYLISLVLFFGLLCLVNFLEMELKFY